MVDTIPKFCSRAVHWSKTATPLRRFGMDSIIHGLLEDAADNSRSREELVQRDVEIVSDRA